MNNFEVGPQELPANWSLVPLKEFRGKKAKSIAPSDSPSEIFELYSVPSFSEGCPELSIGDDIGSSKRLVEPNTVLLSKINPRINRVWIVGGGSKYRQISSPEWIEFFPTEAVCPKYLMYFMQNQRFREHLCMNVSGVGGSLTRVRPKVAEDYLLPLAPLEQQKRIIAKIEELFSHIDAGIDALNKAKQLLKQYRQSVLKAAVTGELTKEWRELRLKDDVPGSTSATGAGSAGATKLVPASQLLECILKERRQKWEQQQLEQFKAKGKIPKNDKWKEKYKEPKGADIENLPQIPSEWQWATLPQLGELNRGKSKHRPRNDPKLYGGNYPFVQTGDVRAASGWITEYEKTYSEEGLKQSRLWSKGTLCITIAANIADTAVLGIDACFPDSVVGFIPYDERVDVELVEFFVRTVKGELEKYAPATAQKNINLAILETVGVPLLPFEEQKQLVEDVKNKLLIIQRLNLEIDRKLVMAEKNKQSILASAFSGRLI